MREWIVASVLGLGLGAGIASGQTGPSSSSPSPSSSSSSASLQLGPPTPAELMRREDAAAAAGAATQPVSDRPQVEAGLTEFLTTRFHAHEPIYFVAGPVDPNSKFQISLKYELFGEGGQVSQVAPWAPDLYVAYSQTSFWDIGGDSSPFFDSSYRPEFLYQSKPARAHWLPGMTRFDLQAGVKHESNGKAGADSRSLNTAYISPIFTFGNDGLPADIDNPNAFFIGIAPRVWMYLTPMPDNPDIYEYEGYGDIRLVVGWRGGFQAAFAVGVGNDWDKGSLQIDLTYPLQKLAIRDLGMYLDAQFFTGYGESLLDYDESTTAFRLGVSLVR